MFNAIFVDKLYQGKCHCNKRKNKFGGQNEKSLVHYRFSTFIRTWNIKRSSRSCYWNGRFL